MANKKYSISLSHPRFNKRNNSSQIKERLLTESIHKEENIKNDEYIKRYNKALLPSINNIDNLIVNILSRNDIEIEKDYQAYYLRLNINNKNNHVYINIRIYSDCIEIQTEQSSQYDIVNIKNDFLFKKYEDVIEKKFFDTLNMRTNKVIQIINDATNINRKNKIDKLVNTK